MSASTELSLSRTQNTQLSRPRPRPARYSRRLNPAQSDMQPFKDIEPNVFVAKSMIKSAGLGVFTRRKIKFDETVCLYSGRCMPTRPQDMSAYVVGPVMWTDPKTGKKTQHWIDASDSHNASGRLINDACDEYPDCPEFPLAARTKYTTNVRFKTTLSTNIHPVIGRYTVKVVAKFDIPRNCELFVKYGLQYWLNNPHHYVLGKDPLFLTDDLYDTHTDV